MPDQQHRDRITRVSGWAHTLHRMRLVPMACLAFMMWLTWDFHLFYKAHALEMKDWQLVGVGAYAAAFVATIKFMFEHISKRIEKDDD